MSLKPKIEITSESDFREKVGLTEPVTLEWEEGKVVEATQHALDGLKRNMEGKAVLQKQKLAEDFIRANEQRDAVDRLTERFGKKLITNPAVLATAGGVAAAVGTAAHALDRKVEEVTGEKIGFMDSIRDWLKEAADEGSGVMKTVWMLLYKMFGGKKKDEEEGKGEDDDMQKSDISESEIKNSIRGAKHVFEVLQGSKKADSSLQPYFTHKRILSYSLKTLRNMYQGSESNKKELAKKLGFSQEKDTENVYKTLTLLLSPECSELMKSGGIQNADELPVAKLFSSTAKYTDFLDRLKEKRGGLDIKDFSFKDSVSVSGASVKEFVGEKKEMLDDLRTRFKGFSPHVLSMIHTSYSTRPISQDKDYSVHINDLKTDEEREFATKTLPEYGDALPGLLESMSFGSERTKKMIQDHIRLNGLTHSDLIDFFVFSGGNTDRSKMNSWEKAQVISRIFLMIHHKDGAVGYAYFLILTGGAISKGETMNIPPDVKMLVHDIMGVTFDVLKGTGEEGLNFAKGFIQAYPQYAAAGGTVLISLIWLAIKLNPVTRVISTVGFLSTVLGISGLAFGAYYVTADGIFNKETKQKVGDIDDLANKVISHKI